jgi:uncharacterized protein
LMVSNGKQFVGREHERRVLDELYNVNNSDLLAVLGRRRVGKTHMVKQILAGRIDFHLTGIEGSSKETMIKAFVKKLNQISRQSKRAPESWIEVFELLKDFLAKQPVKKKKVIFLDELPWMDSHLSGFLQAFEFFWNDWAVDQNILVVICGSSTSWMIDHIMENQGGLHNRVAKYLYVKPFTLSEVEAFFIKRNIRLSHYEIIQIYMAVGGIPYYLEQVMKGESAIQAIDRILFSEESTLKYEFKNLYRALFANHEKYEEVIKALSTKRRGLSRNEIITATAITNGGGLSKILDELEECSFIKSYLPYGKSKRDTLYRLIDEYSVFYYQFSPDVRKRGSFINLLTSPKLKAWQGFSFETLCMKNADKIKDALKIGGVFSEENSFIYKDKKEGGFQIDLLIDRSDNIINICEMKYYTGIFTLSKIEAEKWRHRKEQFRIVSKTKKHLMTTLVTTYGLKQNQYSLGVVDNVVTIDDLF